MQTDIDFNEIHYVAQVSVLCCHVHYFTARKRVKSYSLHHKLILHLPDESDDNHSAKPDDHPNEESEHDSANSAKSTTAKKSSSHENPPLLLLAKHLAKQRH